MKEFWNNQYLIVDKISSNETKGLIKNALFRVKQEQGELFWKRGAKQFVQRKYGKTIPSQEDKKYFKKYTNEIFTIKGKDWFDMRTFKGLVELAKNGYGLEMHLQHAQDFLDCLACLGEEKVKKLIKEMRL